MGFPIRYSSGEDLILDDNDNEYSYISGPSGFLMDALFLQDKYKEKKFENKEYKIQYCFGTGAPCPKIMDTLNTLYDKELETNKINSKFVFKKSNKTVLRDKFTFSSLKTIEMPQYIDIKKIAIAPITGVIKKIIGLLNFAQKEEIESFLLMAPEDNRPSIEIMLDIYRENKYITGAANYIKTCNELKEINLYEKNNTINTIKINRAFIAENSNNFNIFELIIQKTAAILEDDTNLYTKLFLEQPAYLLVFLGDAIVYANSEKQKTQKARDELNIILQALPKDHKFNTPDKTTQNNIIKILKEYLSFTKITKPEDSSIPNTTNTDPNIGETNHHIINTPLSDISIKTTEKETKEHCLKKYFCCFKKLYKKN
jgi:hypothetical protein